VAPDGRASRARQVIYGASRYSRATWTRDGRILFEKQAGDDRHIWVMDPKSGSQKQLTFEASNYNPSVCGDGRYVVHLVERSGKFAIRRMDLEGGSPLVLLSVDEEIVPQCSPDGRWVIYTAVGSGQWRVLWKVPVAGGPPVRLNDQFSRQPAISPDGTRVAFFCVREGSTLQNEPTGIALLSMDGGRPSTVYDLPRTAFEPAGLRWTRDGKAITYVDNREGVSNIWSQPVAGGRPRQLTDFKGDRIFFFDWSWDGRQLAFSRGTRTFDAVLVRSAD
jgi:Tol biopolymer transport system component